MRVCDISRVDDLVDREAVIAVGDVVVYRVVEHKRLLLNVAYALTVVVHIDVADIHTADRDSSLIVIVVTQKQVDQCRLTRSRRTYYTDDVAGLDGEVDILENLLCAVEREVYVLEFNSSANISVAVALTEVVLGLCVEDIHNSLNRRHRVLHRVGKVCKEVDRLVEHSRVGDKGNEQTDRDRTYAVCLNSIDDEVAAHSPDYNASKAHKAVYDSGIGVEYLTRLAVDLSPFLDRRFKSLGRLLLVCKGLYNADTGDGIGKHRGNCRRASPDTAVEGRDLLSKYSRADNYERHGNEREERELPVKAKHYYDDTDQLEELYHDFLRHTEHKCLNGRGVSAYTVDNRSRRGLIVKAHRQVLCLLVYVCTYARDDLVSRDTKHIATHTCHKPAHNVNTDKQYHYEGKCRVSTEFLHIFNQHIVNKEPRKQRRNECHRGGKN